MPYRYMTIHVRNFHKDNGYRPPTLTARYATGGIFFNNGTHIGEVFVFWLGDVMKTLPELGKTFKFFLTQDGTYFNVVGVFPVEESGGVTITAYAQPNTPVSEGEGFGFSYQAWRWDWGQLPTSYYNYIAGTNDIPGTAEFDAVVASFNTWENDEFSGMDYTYQGTTTRFPGWPPPADGWNVVYWITFATPPDWAAVTFSYAQNMGSYYRVSEFDIWFNDNLAWGIGDPSRLDVQNVGTHEAGHSLVLLDLNQTGNEDQTMWYTTTIGETKKRDLYWGDLNGVHYIYRRENDAGLGVEAGNSFDTANYVNKERLYSSRLCYLPQSGDVDTQDWYKFITSAGRKLGIVMRPPSWADFDLELYNPSGQLVAYSRNRGLGVQESIIYEETEVYGYWRIRVYAYTTGGSGGNGVYTFMIRDITHIQSPSVN